MCNISNSKKDRKKKRELIFSFFLQLKLIFVKGVYCFITFAKVWHALVMIIEK